jgi:transcription elongation factor Elf1
MSELNLIKTVLFNAATLSEALTRLTELGIEYRPCSFIDNGYHIESSKTEVFEITIYPNPNSQRCPVAVIMDGHLFYYEDRIPFLAGQPETVETLVPAASPDDAGQRPDFVTCPNCFTTDCSPVGELNHVRDFICNVCGVDFTPENEQSTETVDNINWHEPADRFDYVKSYVKIDQLRNILRHERRLKNSRVKGLAS